VSEPIDVSRAPHYRWGRASDGWHLVERADLSVIQECVPPGDAERRHRHHAARQFFYVLEGEAVLDVDGAAHVLHAGQGLEVAPGVAHQFRNESSAPVTFLVISAPRAHGDRVDL
jgi:mannose-6-phosphate isomerase-like protein (cupin superfamily)